MLPINRIWTKVLSESIRINTPLVPSSSETKTDDEPTISPLMVFATLYDIQHIPSIVHTLIEFVAIHTNVKMEIFAIL